MLTPEFLTVTYLGAGILFILSLSGLSTQATAKQGNLYGIIGMALAVIATMLGIATMHLPILFISLALGGLIGATLAKRVAMTAMPELVAILHSFVGLAAVLVGFGSFLENHSLTGAEQVIHLFEIYLGIFIGGITFIGSIIAWGKLKGSISSKPLLLPARHFFNLLLIIIVTVLCVFFVTDPENGLIPLGVMTVISGIIGWHMVMAIGGADMPVVVSMLNSYSGWAAAASGFMLSNDLLIVTGALVGSSGAILSYIMCKAMNRSFLSVILGGFGGGEGSAPKSTKTSSEPQGTVTQINAEETAELLLSSKSVVIIPGYGMAVAQAQHAIREMTEILSKSKTFVRFAIHPVAGRLPGHMNVLLAEANIPYDIVLEMDEFNSEFPKMDVVLVVGANDIVNPAALEDAESPIYGMPVLECWKSKTVIMLKRSMAVGYAGIDNPLCYKENTRMLFGDAKKSIDSVLMQMKTKSSE